MDYLERKAKTHRGRKHLEHYKPQLEEGERRILLTQGSKTSNLSINALGFFSRLLRSRSTKINARYETRPFEDDQLLLHLSDKHHCPLFFFASNSKKRPNRLVLGRVFDRKMLELIEFEVKELAGGFSALNGISSSQRVTFVAVGDVFENDDRMRRVRNIFHDVFSSSVSTINLRETMGFVVTMVGIDEKQVCFRLYRAERGHLLDLELKLTLSIERAVLCENDAFEEACKQPKKKKKVKNLEDNEIGQKLGRVHVRQQDLRTLRLKKIKKMREKVDKKEI